MRNARTSSANARVMAADDPHSARKDVAAADLCSTCNQISMCRQRKTYRPPVLFCEEFDDYTVPVVAPESRPSEGKAAALAYKGLCMNCEQRTECDQARTAAGIWHCEEYR